MAGDARIIEVADGLVETVRLAWADDAGTSDVQEPDECRRAYRDRTAVKDFHGRKVVIFPDPEESYSDEFTTRGKITTTYRFIVVIAERFEDVDLIESDAFTAWLDERLGFVDRVVYGTVGNFGAPDAFLSVPGHGNIWSQDVHMDVLFDPNELETNQMFWAQFRLTMQEGEL